jgi:hypothetical protein
MGLCKWGITRYNGFYNWQSLSTDRVTLFGVNINLGYIVKSKSDDTMEDYECGDIVFGKQYPYSIIEGEEYD